MYDEAIFRDREHDPATIYWLEIRGTGGGNTEDSPLPIDKEYDRFTQATMVPHSRQTLLPEYTLIAPSWKPRSSPTSNQEGSTSGGTYESLLLKRTRVPEEPARPRPLRSYFLRFPV